MKTGLFLPTFSFLSPIHFPLFPFPPSNPHLSSILQKVTTFSFCCVWHASCVGAKWLATGLGRRYDIDLVPAHSGRTRHHTNCVPIAQTLFPDPHICSKSSHKICRLLFLCRGLSTHTHHTAFLIFNFKGGPAKPPHDGRQKRLSHFNTQNGSILKWCTFHFLLSWSSFDRNLRFTPLAKLVFPSRDKLIF